MPPPMPPLLPFAAGLVAGGLAVRLWRSEEARAGVKSALDTLTETARSGLAMISPAPQKAAAEQAAKPAARAKKVPAHGKKTTPARKKAGKRKAAQS